MSLRNPLIVLAASLLAVGLASAHEPRTGKAQAGAPRSKAAAKQRAEPRQAPGVLVLLPAGQNPDTLGNGCWVRFFDDQDFKGDQLTVVGPVDLPDMKFHHRFSWSAPDSLIAGPKAKVVVYDTEGYKNRNGTVNPSEQVKDLGDKTRGLFEDIESVKITCNP